MLRSPGFYTGGGSVGSVGIDVYTVSGETDLLGKKASELMEGITVEGDTVTGMLNYVTGYTGFHGSDPEELEVRADAPTMLKVMGLMGQESPGIEEILETYSLLFPEESRKTLEELKLGFKDLVIVIQEAVSLIAGEETAPGEQ